MAEAIVLKGHVLTGVYILVNRITSEGIWFKIWIIPTSVVIYYQPINCLKGQNNLKKNVA